MKVFSHPSFSMRLTSFLLRGFKNQLIEKNCTDWQNKILSRARAEPASIPYWLKRKCRITEAECLGQRVIILEKKHTNFDQEIIYLHGGAFVHPLHAVHWIIVSQLLENTNARVTVPLYPLAPENSFESAMEFIAKVYSDLTEKYEGHKISVYGDSAGGNLAMALIQFCRNENITQPNHVVLFSPWLDLTMSNPEISEQECKDVMLGIPGLVQAGEWWAKNWDVNSPMLSPIHADLKGLPPISIFQGTRDLFIEDVRKFYEISKKRGGNVKLYEYQGGFHAFMFAIHTPEARDVFNRVRKL